MHLCCYNGRKRRQLRQRISLEHMGQFLLQLNHLSEKFGAFLDRFFFEFVLNEDLLGHINDCFHNPKVILLLLQISDALRCDCVTRIAKLEVQIVAGEQDNINALVVIIILNRPDFQLVI